MTLDRARIIGKNNARKPRPIVVKFHKFAERESICEQGYVKKTRTETL